MIPKIGMIVRYKGNKLKIRIIYKIEKNCSGEIQVYLKNLILPNHGTQYYPLFGFWNTYVEFKGRRYAK